MATLSEMSSDSSTHAQTSPNTPTDIDTARNHPHRLFYPPNAPRQFERTPGLTRSSTLGPPETDRSLAANIPPHALSEDLNHSTSQRPSPSFLNNGSRPATPPTARRLLNHSSSGYADPLSDFLNDIDNISQSASSKNPSTSLTSTYVHAIKIR